MISMETQHKTMEIRLSDMTANIPKEMKTKIEAQSNGSEFWRISVVNSTAKPKVERLMIIGRLRSLAVHAGENFGIEDS